MITTLLGFFKDAAFVLFSILPLVAAVLVAAAGLRRWGGRKGGAMDGAARAASSAYARTIFPPSLRGGGVVVPTMPSRPMVRSRRRRGPQPPRRP
jgi:hypothetical protein